MLNQDFIERLNKLNQILTDSKNVVFFGGAGVSTESGIPDFRSKDGLYNQNDVEFSQYSPEYLLSSACLHKEPRVFYTYYRQKLDTRGILPNPAHTVLAKLEKQGKLIGIITQNIDGLHQEAGSIKVAEIHGSTKRNYCSYCGKKYNADYIFENNDVIPMCDCKSGMVRPEVTLYGESLPPKAWDMARDWIHTADCLIVGGTSIQVYPAASLVYEFTGKYLIIINRDRLSVEERADLVFHEPIGEVFKAVRLLN